MKSRRQTITCRIGMFFSLSIRMLLVISMLESMHQSARADGKIKIKNLCRVKGQEENTLQGLGLVVGLNGTGDGGDYLPAIRSLARMMQRMGIPLAKESIDLKNTKNVALVLVTATVPASGSRQGDKLDCTISSIGSCKSLEGGRLFLTALQGPQAENKRIFAFAEGAVQIDDPKMLRTARVHQGCRLEEDFFNVFSKDNTITLVLDKNRADFQTAESVAELINNSPVMQKVDGSESQLGQGEQDERMAKAIDQQNIVIKIPGEYRDEPVSFIAEILELSLYGVNTRAEVRINERTGSIIIGSEVSIGPVAVNHKSISVETGQAPRGDRFIAVDSVNKGPTKLQDLVSAMNAIKVPTGDIIEIIKRIEKSGNLQGWLIIEP